MSVEYQPQQILRLYFESNDIVNIRITINDDVKVIQCRTTMAFTKSLDIDQKTRITIENLTPDLACNVVRVCLNYLDITKLMYRWSKTYTKQDMTPLGDFVSDLYAPDICVIDLVPSNVYRGLLQPFKDGDVTYHAP